MEWDKHSLIEYQNTANILLAIKNMYEIEYKIKIY